MFILVHDFADPEWASIDQGVFMCINCSGVFRSFGRVKSVALDGWTAKEIEVHLNLLYNMWWYHSPCKL